MLTKEKSSQKRKSVNTQNNSVSYFRLSNTGLHHHHHDNNQLRNNKKWSYEWVVLPNGYKRSLLSKINYHTSSIFQGKVFLKLSGC